MMTRLFTVILFILAIAGCASSPVYINDSYELSVTNEVRDKLLEDWFRCDECVNGQLRRVQELGNAALRPLELAMTGTIPDLESKLNGYQARCNRINSKLKGRELGPAENCLQYRERFRHNLEQRYRVRAIEALLAIRTPETCNAIGVARCLGNRPFPPFDFGQVGKRSSLENGIVQ